MRVRDALGPLFEDEDFAGGRFAGMYSGMGRPGLSAALLAMVTVLQFLHNLSDREAAEAAADRISWKYALVRHEALLFRARVRGPCRWSVAAGR